MPKNILVIFIPLLLFLVSCQEVYDADIRKRDDFLVVRALVTDREGEHIVQLKNTVAYGQRLNQEPERNAVVYVDDGEGNRFDFQETEPGIYIHNGGFAVENQTYILHIELADGHVYQSLPQRLNEVQPLDSIYGEFMSKLQDIPDHNNELVPTWVQGIELYTDLDMSGDFARRLRFEPQLLIQYSQIVAVEVCYEYVPQDSSFCDMYDDDDPPWLFCRTKVPLGTEINLTRPVFDMPTGDTYQHNLGFVPRDKRFYPLKFNGQFDRRILLARQYGLTEDAFEFYRDIIEQMTAENALFDPIATQITGNIICTSDPERIALGLFEVAGASVQSFVMNHEPLDRNDIWLKEIPDLSFLPDHRCHLETIPEFWIYY